MSVGQATYTFAVVIESGNDEFWEADPPPSEVTSTVAAALESNGFSVADIRLTKMLWQSDE